MMELVGADDECFTHILNQSHKTIHMAKQDTLY